MWHPALVQALCAQRPRQNWPAMSRLRPVDAWSVSNFAREPNGDRDRRPPIASITSCRRHSSSLPRSAPEVLGATTPRALSRWTRPKKRCSSCTANARSLADGQAILELGCGWGSLTLWMAEQLSERARSPQCRTRAPARAHRIAQCRRRGLPMLQVITRRRQSAWTVRDARSIAVVRSRCSNTCATTGSCCERSRVAGPGGKLFVHIFCPPTLMYPFETEGERQLDGPALFHRRADACGRHLAAVPGRPAHRTAWLLPGTHYQRTANHWLANQDAHRAQVLTILASLWSRQAHALWDQRWRMFWMSCAELFGYAEGANGWWRTTALLGA